MVFGLSILIIKMGTPIIIGWVIYENPIVWRIVVTEPCIEVVGWLEVIIINHLTSGEHK
jgi:hypothetical protein